MANSNYEPKTPKTYVSPLPSGNEFTFVSARTIFPYRADAPYGTYYSHKVVLNGITIDENEYIILPSGTSGKDVGFSTILSSGTYVIKYEIWDYANGNKQDKLNSATYTFIVVENRLPLKKYTITDVINRTLAVAEPIRKGERPRFRLNGMRADGTIITESNKQEGEEVGQAALFDTIIAPQFSFTKQTLRECLQEVGGVIHGEPRLRIKKDENGYYFEVFYDMYGEGKRAYISTRRCQSMTSSYAIESFASHLDSNAENLINTLDKYSGVIKEPFNGGYKTVRTETQYSRITDENMLIATQYPIYSVEKLEYIAVIPNPIPPNNPILIPYDITAYLFEASVYNTQLSSYDGEYPYSRAYGLRYKQGEKNIDALNFKQDSAILPAYENYAIVNILRKVTGNDSFEVESYPSLAFRVTYTPIYNTRVSQTKPYYKENPRAAALIFNQQSNLVESRYYGENLKGLIARIGNLEQTRTYHLSTYSYIPKAGQKFNDEYYIAAVSVEYLPTYIKCTIGLSKDFNRLSQYIGINSQKRYSEISQSQANERNILYREFIVIGDAETPSGDSIIGDDMLSAIADTFTQNGNYQPLTGVVAWGSSYKGNDLPIVCLPVVSSAFGNSMSFSWQYDDNYSAGATSTYRENGSGSSKVSGYFQGDYRYTDYYGRMYYYDFDIQVKGQQEDGYTLPKGIKPTKASGYVSTMGKSPYILRKDNREKLQVNVQVDFVTNKQDIIIGSALASYCGAVRGSDPALKSKLYVFPERLNKFINHVNGSVSIDLDTLPSVEITVGNAENGQFVLNAENFPSDGEAWAIVTEQTDLPPEEVEDEEGNVTMQSQIKGGDVLLAQNTKITAGQSFTPIYFTRKRKIFDETVWKDKR